MNFRQLRHQSWVFILRFARGQIINPELFSPSTELNVSTVGGDATMELPASSAPLSVLSRALVPVLSKMAINWRYDIVCFGTVYAAERVSFGGLD
jgi:hypothetical protein